MVLLSARDRVRWEYVTIHQELLSNGQKTDGDSNESWEVTNFGHLPGIGLLYRGEIICLNSSKDIMEVLM